ncbi:MAG: FAD-dependent oxidoreductase [Spirochaetes bacterium]|nr:FAD-dependent oxidoreductase [Spirochaetota bacterium]
MNEVTAKEKEVLVVGGGIGGITAALELAGCGIHVTMLEQTATIGGRMIQLDKTFPTLDCSTCTLSPKMVEVALNQKIDLLSWAKLLAVKKNGAGFTASIVKRSRYVNIEKCTACGTCFAGCPVVMKSEFNMETGTRKAIYIPFPQAIPNKAVIDKRESQLCPMPCKHVCPVGTNVPGYLKHISEGRHKDAYMLIRETNPFPSVCGRVCYAPCEEVCCRGQIDSPLAIRDIKRFAADSFDTDSLVPPQIQKTGEKVAVIGAGPAGLSCAHDCALQGYDVTVFEDLPEAGGMLRYGIPEYRLPKVELKKEIDYIKKLGVDIRCSTAAGKDIAFDELKEDYNAVFIAVGAQKGVPLGVPGEDSRGVMEGIKFLRDFNSGAAPTVGGACAVIGGGNTAVDCARTAKRLGAGSVKLVYRRTRDEMPAAREEIEALENEGIEIEFLAVPVRFLAENGKLSAMECARMEPGDPDADGRRKPVKINSSEFVMPVDTVITALGQAMDLSFLNGTASSLINNNYIKADSAACTTEIEGIFAGGDSVTGPAYVIEAIAAGKRAALSIGKYLRKESVIPQIKNAQPGRLNNEEIRFAAERYGREERIAMTEEPSGERIFDFREVSSGYKAEEAEAEASRCIAGKVEGCIECGECERRCEVKAIDYSIKDEIVDLDFDGIVLAPGFDLYDPSEKKEYGYGVYNGVMTGMEFERLSSVTGPTGGDILLNGKIPKRFFFIQCVGSRERQSGARYCSRVCCMYTAKHASIIRDRIKDAEIYVSYIDVRAYGKNYDEFYKSAQENGIFYIKGIPGEVTKTENGLLVRVEDMLGGQLLEIEADMVILATGIRPRKEIEELCGIMSIDKDEYGFIRTDSIEPSKTSVEGIFACGMGTGPKDVPDTVASGGEAAARCMEYINQ